MAARYGDVILKELGKSVGMVSEEKLAETEASILHAKRVFCDGLGRSGLCIRGLAMRLMQMGLTAYVVGCTTTPSIGRGDVLIISSGSGQSATLISRAVKAKKCGAEIVLFTGSPCSGLAETADTVLEIQVPSKTGDNGVFTSALPLGSLFEATIMILFECMVMSLMQKLEETSDTMIGRHANLE